MFELAVCLLQLQSPLLLWLQYVCSQAPALTNRCDHHPVRALCGVEQSLVSVMVSASHDLQAAGLMFEELCLVLGHPSSDLQDPKTSIHPQGCGTKRMYYVRFSQKSGVWPFREKENFH